MFETASSPSSRTYPAARGFRHEESRVYTQRMGALSVSVEAPRGGRLSILLEGELDLGSASFLRDVFVSTLPRASAVVLDLDRVSFMDSSGLTAVLACATECEQRGLEFAVTEGSPQVRRLFEITRVAETLRLSAAKKPSRDRAGVPVHAASPARRSRRLHQGDHAG